MDVITLAMVETMVSAIANPSVKLMDLARRLRAGGTVTSEELAAAKAESDGTVIELQEAAVHDRASNDWQSFLARISSRKFLVALAVEIAAVVALFMPAENPGEIEAAAVKVAALATMLLAALGYGIVNRTK